MRLKASPVLTLPVNTPGRCRHLLLAVLIVLLASGPAAAGQAVTAEAIRTELATAMEEDGALGLVTEQWDLPQQTAVIVHDHLRRMLRDPAVLDFLADELSRNWSLFGEVPPSELASAAHALTAAMIQSKTADGLRRLPPEDLRALYDILPDLFAAMPPDDCAATIRGDATALQSQNAEIEALKTLPPEVVAAYLGLSREAVLAELRNHPPFVPLNPTERGFARAAFETALIAEVRQRPDRDRLIAAAGAIAAAPDAEVCAFGRLSATVARGVEGTVGDWVRRLLVE